MKSNIIIIFILLSVGTAAGDLTIIAKSKSVLRFTLSAQLVVETGIEKLDLINAIHCCRKIEKIYKTIQDPVLINKLGMGRVFLITIECNIKDTAKVISDYKETGLFEYVEVNELVTSISHTPFFPNDIAFKWQWGFHNTGTNVTSGTREDVDIDMPEAWGIEQGDSSEIIAILDSGIKNQHGEFNNRFWKNKSEIPGDKVDNDNNGYVDDVNGWNFAYGDTLIEDDRGHGTAVATIIAANVNNDSAFAGINGKSKLMILKITDINGRAYASSIASAIQYATDKGARVINFSHASPSKLVLVAEAIEYAYKNNVLICAGSGNNDADSVYYPAKYPHVIAVGATNHFDKRCKGWLIEDSTIGGSNYGDSLDVVAPGEKIPVLGYKYGDFQQKDGTSYSTAFVTGLASLLISQNPDITPDIITQIIETTAEDQVGDPAEDTKGYDKYYGYGRINAYKALLKGEELITGKKPKALTNIETAKLISYSKAGNKLIIRTVGSKRTSPIIVRIFDASGRLIQQVSLEKNVATNTIKLSPLPSGMYFYSVKFDGLVHGGKILN